VGTLLGSLQVNVDAKTSRFDAGMARGKKSLSGFTKATGFATGAMGKLVGVLGAAASVTAFTGMIKRNLALIDTLGKTSSKLGITTEALTSLQHGAALTGVSSEGMSSALERMTRNVSDAAQGTGEAVGAFNELGLSASALVRLSPDQALARIADAMLGVTNQADKVRLSFELFGRSGVGMVNTLAGGSEGLREFEADAKRLGILLSGDQVKQVEAANDAIHRLGQAFSGAARQITAGLAANIKIFADDISDAVLSLRDSRNNLGGLGELLEPENVGILQDIGSALNRVFIGGQAAAVGFSADLAAAAKYATGGRLGTGQFADSLGAAKQEAFAGTRAAFAAPLPSTRAANLRAGLDENTGQPLSAEQRRVQAKQLLTQEQMEAHLRALAQQNGQTQQPVPVRF